MEHDPPSSRACKVMLHAATCFHSKLSISMSSRSFFDTSHLIRATVSSAKRMPKRFHFFFFVAAFLAHGTLRFVVKSATYKCRKALHKPNRLFSPLSHLRLSTEFLRHLCDTLAGSHSCNSSEGTLHPMPLTWFSSRTAFQIKRLSIF